MAPAHWHPMNQAVIIERRPPQRPPPITQAGNEAHHCQYHQAATIEPILHTVRLKMNAKLKMKSNLPAVLERRLLVPAQQTLKVSLVAVVFNGGHANALCSSASIAMAVNGHCVLMCVGVCVCE